MSRTDDELPAFERGPLVPIATYLVVISVLSALLLFSPTESPPPILGIAWGVFLVVLTISACTFEGVSLRSIPGSVRDLVPVITVLIAFWGLYNLAALWLALGGATGFEATWSSVATNPLPYLAALLSSFLFTAVPEELIFRTYFQQKLTAMAGSEPRRAAVAGVVVVAVLFAIFHLPRWFLASGHGAGITLIIRLIELAFMGLTYGIVFAITRNLWLVAYFHATMNVPPILVAVNVPPDLHFVVGIIEYTAIISVVYLYAHITSPNRMALARSQHEGAP